MLYMSVTLIVSSSHRSNVSDRTLVTWTPRLRCIPEQAMHITMPRLILAQSKSVMSAEAGVK